jgi:uncharacterized protein
MCPVIMREQKGKLERVASIVALRLIRAYQLLVSPALSPSCRFDPTCSVYAAQAVDRFGVLRGFYLALRRILRCHPFTKGGLDPVPCFAPAGERTPSTQGE